MSKAINAAEELERATRMFDGLRVAAEQLRAVGKVDVAIESRQKQLAKLDEEIAQKRRESEMAVDQAKSQSSTAKKTLEQATQEAERIIAEANDTASRVADQAKRTAADIEKEDQAKRDKALSNYSARIKELGDRERKLNKQIAEAQEKLDKLAEQELALQNKLQEAKSRIAALIKD
jgi:predicted  nucleic acid-binding Zn-ribbon protein